MKSLYSLTEAAKRLGISRQYCWTIIQMGRLKAERIGNQWVIREETILNGIDKTSSMQKDS